MTNENYWTNHKTRLSSININLKLKIKNALKKDQDLASSKVTYSFVILLIRLPLFLYITLLTL